MKVRILSVGNKMPKWVQTGFDEYLVVCQKVCWLKLEQFLKP